jgi:peptidoglycan hydrolase-like protein with peptidoglycan-binding domain
MPHTVASSTASSARPVPGRPVESLRHPAVRAGDDDRRLREGSRGPAVADLQRALAARGHDLAVDGIFGPKTKGAVIAFQRAQGLDVDGIAGPATKAALRTVADRDPGDRLEPTVRGSGLRAPTESDRAPGAGGAARAGTLLSPPTRGLSSGRSGVAATGIGTGIAAGAAGASGAATVAGGAANTGTAVSLAATATSGDASAARGMAQRAVTIDGHTFRVHARTRADVGRHSVPGRRLISLDANSSAGREEILRPLIVIPNNATAAERRAAQASVDRVARWLDENAPGTRRGSGLVLTTAQNGRGLRGFFHTEFFSVNDSAAVRLVKERPAEFARILGETLGTIPGANFILPHGVRGDPGAVSADEQTSELGLARHVVAHGFGRL